MNEVHRSPRPVAIWLLVGVGMIMIQVLLGGITRLTGSGLSITEWEPILGTIPPLNEQDWQIAFDKYKEIGQFKHLNFTFDLQDFKSIYFWEWLHRTWGRLLGVAFTIPFIIFLFQRRFKKEMIYPMIILFLLGALQGAVGWIMVKSGLNEEDIYVDHIRLAVHFIAALILLCYTFWFALVLFFRRNQFVIDPGLKKLTSALVILLAVQLIYGAFMAGLKAATSAPTWPTMNGMWIPEGLGKLQGLNDLTSNPITVQFIHRTIAFLFLLLVAIWWIRAKNILASSLLSKTRSLPVIITLIQFLLGILTVVYSPNRNALLWFGVSHQFMAILLVLLFTWMMYMIRSGPQPVQKQS
jgi:cytochrome c oxidase assembly protein subunit 15